MNYSMEVDEEKVEALVHTSGLHYSDFDSKSKQPMFLFNLTSVVVDHVIKMILKAKSIIL